MSKSRSKDTGLNGDEIRKNKSSSLGAPTISAIEGLLELDNADRQILKYKIEYPDMKASKLARMLGMSESFVRNRIKTPSFLFAEQRLSGTTDKIMINAAKIAARKLIDLLDHPNPIIALGAVRIALTRHLSQKIDPNEGQLVAYKTTIAPDGNLLQDVIREELEQITIDVSGNNGA